MKFQVEVYEKETGICIDRINAISILTDNCFYKIEPHFEEEANRTRSYRISETELSTKSFLDRGNTLMVKLRFRRIPYLYPNVLSYKTVDMPDGLEYLRVEYRPWLQDNIRVHMISMGQVETWEEKCNVKSDF